MFRYQDRTVYCQADGKWANKLNDAPQPSTLHATRKEAIAMAKQMLINSGGGELKIDCHEPGTPELTRSIGDTHSQPSSAGDHGP